MVFEREGNLFGHIPLVQLRAPEPVFDTDQKLHRIVKQARQNDFFRQTFLEGQVGALQTVILGGQAVLEEVKKVGLSGSGGSIVTFWPSRLVTNRLPTPLR
jgi:hypothetical protein